MLVSGSRRLNVYRRVRTHDLAILGLKLGSGSQKGENFLVVLMPAFVLRCAGDLCIFLFSYAKSDRIRRHRRWHAFGMGVDMPVLAGNLLDERVRTMPARNSCAHGHVRALV